MVRHSRHGAVSLRGTAVESGPMSGVLALWLWLLPASASAKGPVVATHPPAAAPGAGESPRLAPGVSVERDLVAGRSHVYRIDLEPGQFLSLTIQQQGIDVAASLLRPDGTELVSTDAFNDDFRAETLIAIADSAGTHTLRIVTAP